MKGSPRSSMTVRPLFKIDHCFLESLSVDYSTSGGPPLLLMELLVHPTTSLTLQFKETVLMTKEKLNKDSNVRIFFKLSKNTVRYKSLPIQLVLNSLRTNLLIRQKIRDL